MADIQEIQANNTVYDISVKSIGKVEGLSDALDSIDTSISDMGARIDNLQSIGRFLAMWDADTGIARYLEEGFVYEQGDYFIIAQVGTPNFMPTGTSYTGASTTVTTDAIEVSDMFFYDGTRWIYLANHQRQIAVDEDLDDASTNPVENRVVTGALNGKQDILTSNNAGDGISIEEVDGIPVISNTQTSAEWGNIIGNLNDQLDLRQALDEAGQSGGGTQGSITWLDTRSIAQDSGKFGEYENASLYKGWYADILFQLSGSKQYLIDNKDNINICIDRFNRTKHNREKARNQRKYKILNDNRIETDLTLYCWKTSNPNSGNIEIDETQNRYFYTENYYDNVQEMIDSGDIVYTYHGIHNTWFDTDTQSGWATSLDNLVYNGYTTDNFGYDTVYCPEHNVNDIMLTNDLKDANLFKRMRCREYVIDSQSYYLFAESWQTFTDIETTADVYVYADAETEEWLPKFTCRIKDMEKLNVTLSYIGKFGELFTSDTPFVRHTEFDWYHWNNNDFESVSEIMEQISYITEANKEPGQSPKCYIGDYAVKPIRLSDCYFFNSKNRIIIHEEGTENEWEEYLAYAGDYLHFFETLRKHPEWIEDEKELIFKLPYDTYHLLMRIEGYQKTVLMQDDYSFKNNLSMAVANYPHSTKYGASKGGIRVADHARLTESIQFYTKTNDEIRHGERPKSNIIRRKLTVALDGNARQTLL